MKVLKYLLCVSFFSAAINSQASILGDEFIRLGNRINSASLSSDQIQNLGLKLDEVKSILDNTSGAGFICIQGTVYRPGSRNIWAGDSQACSDKNKVLIQGDYACVMGTVYGPGSFEKWSGNSLSCGNRKLVQIGKHYVCIAGTVYSPGGFEQWTGDSNYCEKAVLD